MAKKTVNIDLNQSSASIELTLEEQQDDGNVTILEISPNDVIEIFTNETGAGPFFQFFPKKLPALQWKVEISADPLNPDPHVPSPFDQDTYLSDEENGLSAGINPDDPPDPIEEAPISAELNDAWAAQVEEHENWEFNYTVSFVGNTAQPITRRLRAKRR